MTASQYVEWRQYHRMQPWGDERADIRTALIARILGSVHRKPNTKPPDLEDYLAGQYVEAIRTRRANSTGSTSSARIPQVSKPLTSQSVWRAMTGRMTQRMSDLGVRGKPQAPQPRKSR